MSGPLGRRPPTDWKHVDRYPVRALAGTAAEPVGVPVVFGIDWWSAFDRPTKADGTPWRSGATGTFWVGLEYARTGDESKLGYVRGGHAICAKDHDHDDSASWWSYYDQPDGSCTGFSTCRAATLLNRRRYLAHDVYEQAQLIDEYADTPPEEGSSVRAAFEVLRTRGPRPVLSGVARDPSPADGIAAYRWATSVDEVRAALSLPGSYQGVPWLQSWGRGYPHIVRVPDEVVEFLLSSGGEAGIPTDR